MHFLLRTRLLSILFFVQIGQLLSEMTAMQLTGLQCKGSMQHACSLHHTMLSKH